MAWKWEKWIKGVITQGFIRNIWNSINNTSENFNWKVLTPLMYEEHLALNRSSVPNIQKGFISVLYIVGMISLDKFECLLVVYMAVISWVFVQGGTQDIRQCLIRKYTYDWSEHEESFCDRGHICSCESKSFILMPYYITPLLCYQWARKSD